MSTIRMSMKGSMLGVVFELLEELYGLCAGGDVVDSEDVGSGEQGEGVEGGGACEAVGGCGVEGVVYHGFA